MPDYTFFLNSANPTMISIHQSEVDGSCTINATRVASASEISTYTASAAPDVPVSVTANGSI